MTEPRVKVCATTSADKGRGLFCSHNDAKGCPSILPSESVIFQEIPLEVVPLCFTRICHTCCVVCLRPVGDLVERVRRILSLGDDCVTKKEETDIAALWQTITETEILPNTKASQEKPPTRQATPSTRYSCSKCGAVTCSNACFQVLCRSTPWHWVACESIVPQKSQDCWRHENIERLKCLWKRCIRYAEKHFEVFLIAARVVCHVVLALETEGYAAAQRKKEQLLTYKASQTPCQWEDVALSRLNVDNVSVLCLTDLQSQKSESFNHLCQFLDVRETLLGIASGYSAIVDSEFYNALLVQFERVNAEVSIQDPLLTDFEHALPSLLPLLPNSGLEDQFKTLEMVLRRMHRVLFPSRYVDKDSNILFQSSTVAYRTSLLSLLTDVFDDILGYSYCPVVGFLNHSCIPNAVLEFQWCNIKGVTELPLAVSDETRVPTAESLSEMPVLSDEEYSVKWNGTQVVPRICHSVARLHSLVCQVRTTKPLRNGEEVVIAYVDEFLSVSDRHSQLRSIYGFVCDCQRCFKAPAE